MISNNTPLVNKEWRPDDGWLGIVPGVTTVKEAVDKLGGIGEASEMSNGISFDFRSGLIRVTCIEQKSSISKIWISGQLAEEGSIPRSLKCAQSLFPGLHMVGHDASNAAIYEAAGVRLATPTNTDDADILWIEFFAVCI